MSTPPHLDVKSSGLYGVVRDNPKLVKKEKKKNSVGFMFENHEISMLLSCNVAYRQNVSSNKLLSALFGTSSISSVIKTLVT